MRTVRSLRRWALAGATTIAVVLTTAAAPAPSLAATAPPSITGFSPKSGPVGTLVTITGKHFDGPGLQVSFGGTAGTPETIAAHKITIRVPPLAPTGKAQVKTRYGTAVSGSSFRLTRGIASFPKGAWAGQSITIAGSGFVPGHDLTLKLDGASIGGVGTDENGEFSTIRPLPSNITIGAGHILAAMDTITHVQQKVYIWIFGDWPQSRNDPAQTGDGTAEFLINTSNLKKLVVPYGVYPITSPVVEDDGNIYAGFGGGGNSVTQFNPYVLPYGQYGWTATADGTVTQAPAVANNVVYAVTADTLYAFAEYPSGAQKPLWTAVLGDSANPFAPLVADGRVYVSDGGTGVLQVFDANGVTNCSGSPKVCTPLWFNAFTTVFGPPAVDAKSAGGTGDVYLSVRNGGVNKVVVRTGAGANAGSSAALASTSLSGPSLSGGHVFVSGWSGGSATATLYALDASTEALQWNSGDLGGSAQPTAVTVGGGHVFVQNANGILFAFKSAGCGSSVCGPLWESADYGQGGSTPPTLANGVVYVAAGIQAAPYNDDAQLQLFDASGCGGSTCSALWSSPMLANINSQITVVAGTAFLPGHNGDLSVAILP